MGSYTRMIVSLCLSQMLFAQDVAVALDSSYVVDQIRALGLPEFLQNCMKSSRAIQYGISPQQRAEIVESAVRYSQGTLKDVKASTACSMPGFESTIIEVIQENTTSMVFIESAGKSDDSVFGISIANLDDGTIAPSVTRLRGILDNAQMDPNLIDEMRKAIEGMYHKRDARYFDDFERTLASRVSSLPAYVAKRLSGKTDESRRRLNSALDLLQVEGEVKYLGTKQVVGRHRSSVFAVPTAWGPLIDLIHIVVLDDGPVISGGTIIIGWEALPYIDEYKRVFALSGTQQDQGAIK